MRKVESGFDNQTPLPRTEYCAEYQAYRVKYGVCTEYSVVDCLLMSYSRQPVPPIYIYSTSQCNLTSSTYKRGCYTSKEPMTYTPVRILTLPSKMLGCPSSLKVGLSGLLRRSHTDANSRKKSNYQTKLVCVSCLSSYKAVYSVHTYLNIEL